MLLLIHRPCKKTRPGASGGPASRRESAIVLPPSFFTGGMSIRERIHLDTCSPLTLYLLSETRSRLRVSHVPSWCIRHKECTIGMGEPCKHLIRELFSL